LDTKVKIIEIANEQFKRYGLRSVTMDEIARLAGISKKTIYQEFADKNQLVLEVFAKEIEKDMQAISCVPATDEDIIQHLVGLSTYMRERFADINPMVLNELQRYYPQCWQMFEEFKNNHIYTEIVDVLENGKKQGYFRAELNTEIIARTRMEQMMSTFDPIKFPPSKFNQVELQLELFEHFLHGIFTDKGREAYQKQKKQTNENHN
jgi:AcrR family transcriptional regulator